VLRPVQGESNKRRTLIALLILTALLAGCSTRNPGKSVAMSAGVCFIGLTNLGEFERSEGSEATAVLTSPEVVTPFPWKELVVSWNVELPAGAGLKVEARAHSSRWSSGFYTMGLWAGEASQHKRESVTGQRDEYADVKTDTLVLERQASRAQVRLTLQPGKDGQIPKVKFLGLSFVGAQEEIRRGTTAVAAHGHLLDVPEKSQLAYEDGREWCSPTCVSMVLAYWANKLGREELKHDVPAIAAAVYDRNWPGTGNWAFNTAFAGSIPGMRAFVARLADVAQLEAWVAAGVPPVASVAPDVLNGHGIQGSGGHLVVCIGFTAEGDVMVNDPWVEPGSGAKVRRTIPRARFDAAWSRSRRTVYLIFPEEHIVVSVP